MLGVGAMVKAAARHYGARMPRFELLPGLIRIGRAHKGADVPASSIPTFCISASRPCGRGWTYRGLSATILDRVAPSRARMAPS